MATIPNAEQSVGQLVAQNPYLGNILESLNIDYCCGGGQSLAEVCLERGIDAADVLSRLENAAQQPADTVETSNWLEQSAADLCDHIEATHHAYLRAELPRLTDLIAKYVAVHREAHPDLQEVQEVFHELRDELQPHMLKEEQVLFPAIRLMDTSSGAIHHPFGSVGNPIRCMEHDHQAAGDALARLRQLTVGYVVPNDACPTYRSMLEELQRLELDMHRHVHKENNILFPRALKMEAERS